MHKKLRQILVIVFVYILKDLKISKFIIIINSIYLLFKLNYWE